MNKQNPESDSFALGLACAILRDATEKQASATTAAIEAGAKAAPGILERLGPWLSRAPAAIGSIPIIGGAYDHMFPGNVPNAPATPQINTQTNGNEPFMSPETAKTLGIGVGLPLTALAAGAILSSKKKRNSVEE